MCQETKVFGVSIGLGIGIVKTLCAIATVRWVIQLGVTFGDIVKLDQEHSNSCIFGFAIDANRTTIWHDITNSCNGRMGAG